MVNVLCDLLICGEESQFLRKCNQVHFHRIAGYAGIVSCMAGRFVLRDSADMTQRPENAIDCFCHPAASSTPAAC